ncbi:hypothetical protein M3Y98_00878500 [Aphelenchoides besseyi]|nr:hypothetical protein M3Y98_00878500 [Aphelenchoides besseyi]KAI6195030.1 hypothetical protein M3Y96_01187900 [Aphelenchoides besseyi]
MDPAVIQTALAAGVPIQQVLQYLQQTSNPQTQLSQTAATPNASHHLHQLSAASTPVNASNGTPSNQPNAANLNLSLANAAAVLAAQQQQHQHAQQVAAAQQANQAHAVGQPHQTAASAEPNSLPWPIFQPAVNVPHFSLNDYQKVNLDVQASALASGMDLPFFFNFGVHHARAILLREHFHVQTPNNASAQQSQTASQSQAQTANAAAALSLSQAGQQSLYQQQFLKPEALSTIARPLGGPLPGSTNSAIDSQSAFQLQRDLNTSISINQLQNTLAAQMNKLSGQTTLQQTQSAASAANFRNTSDQVEAFLLQNSLLNSSNAGSQLRLGSQLAASFANPQTLALLQQQQLQNQQQANANEVQRPTAIMPSLPLALAAAASKSGGATTQQLLQQQNVHQQSNTQKQSQLAQTQQTAHQILGGLGFTAQPTSTSSVGHTTNVSATVATVSGSPTSIAQVPIDPAPRTPLVGVKTDGTTTTSAATILGSTPVPLTSSVLASFLQEQQSHDRMKPTSLVRGAIADANRNASPLSRPSATSSSESIPTGQTNPTSKIAVTSSNETTTANAIGQAGNFGNGQMPSLAAQLAGAMMGSFFVRNVGVSSTASNVTTTNTQSIDSIKQPVQVVVPSIVSTTGPSTSTNPPAGLNIAANNPDAHLLAATSPFVKLLSTSAAQTPARSLTSGTSGLIPTTSTITSSSVVEKPTVGTNNLNPSTTNGATTNAVKPVISLSDHPLHQMLGSGAFNGADLDPTTFLRSNDILAATEMNYTETFRRQLQNGSPKLDQSDSKARKSGVNMLGVKDEKRTSLAPSMMINYVNSCFNQLKSTVQSQGVGLPIDQNGRPIDYSSRPIDAIFRKAREQLDREREYTTPHRNNSLSPSILPRPNPNTLSLFDREHGGRHRKNRFKQTFLDALLGMLDGRARSEQPSETLKRVAAAETAQSLTPSATVGITPLTDADNQSRSHSSSTSLGKDSGIGTNSTTAGSNATIKIDESKQSSKNGSQASGQLKSETRKSPSPIKTTTSVAFDDDSDDDDPQAKRLKIVED